MYTVTDLRKGLRLELEGVLFEIIEYRFLKPGKGHALYTCKLRNMLNGSSVTKTFRQSDRFERPMLEEQKLAYSYTDGEHFVFLDENFEQVSISKDILGQARFFLSGEMEINVLFYKKSPVEITLPTFVEKCVMETEPGARGNTATNVLKPATLDGGYQLGVPIFINKGDIVKIDTRNGEYVDRVRRKAD